MKLLTTISLIFCVHKSFSKSIFDTFASSISQDREKCQNIIDVVIPVIKASESRRNGFHEVVIANFAFNNDVGQFMKNLNEDDQIVVNGEINGFGSFDGRTPDFVIIIQDIFNEVKNRKSFSLSSRDIKVKFRQFRFISGLISIHCLKTNACMFLLR